MHGDISRSTFDALKAYSSVRDQQGRHRMDADGNELVDILLHDERTVRADVIGRSGAPQDDAGMAIASTGAALTIGVGRYYVDGIRCEHRRATGTTTPFTDQPWLPGASLPTTDGIYVAYLDVWERPITAIQDPAIREVALGGPDTTTRTQVVWQVKLLPVTTADPAPDCATSFAQWTELLGGSDGQLTVRIAATPTSTNPCVVPETAGYRGLENQLYRLQVHDIGADGPRFKWSRENGSVIAAWREHPAADEVVVERLGPGGAHGFDIGDWVELGDDHDDLYERGGRMARVADIEERVRLVLENLDGALAMVPTRHPQVRRWDAPVRNTAVAPAELGTAGVTADGWIRIEHDIEVRFSGGDLRPGDFWIVPARTAILPGTLDRQIDWPIDGAGNPLAMRPHGPTHHLAKLAVLRRNAGAWTVLDDCRPLFPPLTSLVEFEGRGGDGQHARSGHFVPAPIIVGVSRGREPVVGARVHFAIVSDPTAGTRGGLVGSEPPASGSIATATSLVVTTDANGLARAWWRLGPAPAVESPGDTYQRERGQLVEATLLDDDDAADHLPIRFVAIPVDDMILVDAGGDGQLGLPGATLELRLRARVSHGSQPVLGAQVRFSVLNRVFEGTALTMDQGGSVVAVPGGPAALEVVVPTDADGIASVQWVLGSDRRLPVGRVRAVLLDGAGNDTSQATLFSSHMAIASEIGWTPCTEVGKLVPGRAPNVQSALDLYCQLLTKMSKFQAWVIQRLFDVDLGTGALGNQPFSAFPQEVMNRFLQLLDRPAQTLGPPRQPGGPLLQSGDHGIGNTSPLNSGTGSRQVNARVTFARPFARPPRVVVSLRDLDVIHGDGGRNTRLEVQALAIDPAGFTIRYHTWADTLVFMARTSWIAYADTLD